MTHRMGPFVAVLLFAAAVPATTAQAPPSPARIAELSEQWVDPVTDAPAGTEYRLFETLSRGKGTRGSYLVSLPPSYESEAGRRYPVVYWLHGGFGNARQGAWAVEHWNEGVRKGLLPEAIVVVPQALPVGWYVNSKDGRHPVEDVIVKDLLPHVDATYRTIAQRWARGIEGMSMGGYGALHLGMKHPMLFGAISAVAPAILRDLSEEPRERTFDTFAGDEVYFDANGPWSLSRANAVALRQGCVIRLLIGDQDLRLRSAASAFHDQLGELGIPHEFMEIKGAGHDYQEILVGLEDGGRAFWRRAFQTGPADRAPVAIPPAASATDRSRACSRLLGVDLVDIGGAGSRITGATESSSHGVAVCGVEGVLAPSIGFKVQLPLQAWTGRYLQVGCGGLCGRTSLEVGAAEGCAPLEAGGFAIASTDMGHQGMGGEFGQDPQKREDFAHRGVHLTAVASKRLIRAFYGRDAAHAYFTGCSDGGREALVEAQRYPDDFDGIIAGAPAMNFQVQNSLFHAWQARSNTGEDGKAILVASRLPLLHRAVLEQCDGLDGQVDGLIGDPRACRFDPGTLLCRSSAPGDATDCLTAAEAEAARRLYDGPRDATTGERLTIGGPQPGSELAWAGVFVPRAAGQPIFSERIALDALRNLVFESNPPPGFGLNDVRFDRATFDRLRPLHPLYDATDPDLSGFAGKGGRLILWHGWSDPHISPINTIAYHEAVERSLGRQRTEAFERLYLLPGAYHCSGGEGPSSIDLLTPMIDWVERGVAPDAVIARSQPQGQGQGQGLPPGRSTRMGTAAVEASRAEAAGVRSRPVYPYPSVAKYRGKGDPNQAASYVRAAPLFSAVSPAWAGSDFYRPGMR